MSTLNAYLGVAGLTDVGYRFYNLGTPVAARQTTGVTDTGDGWYGVTGVTPAGDNVRWDSTGTPAAIAREDLSLRILAEANALAVATLATYVDTEVAAIKAKTDNLPADPADASDLAAAFATVAGYLDTEVAAIKAKTDLIPAGGPPAASDYTPERAALLDHLDADVSSVGGGGGGGGGASVADIWGETGLSAYPDHSAGEILSRLDITPPGVSIAVIPGPPSDTSLCRVYGYFETLDNKVAKNVRISFRLVALNEPAAVKSERILSKKPIAVTTNALGQMEIDLQRNDLLDPPGTKYQVTSEEIGLDNKEISLTTALFDLASVI